jgi:uncharacterized protein (TIGR01777 family)
MKKVVLAGGTGFIGSYIAKRFDQIGYQVFIVSREDEHTSWIQNDLKSALENAELVINLAGKSINCRHTEKNRKHIISSRLNSTKLIGGAIKACSVPPKLWINASAAGVYKPSVDEPMTEDKTDFGDDFLANVVRQWEAAFFDFNLPATRQVALRTSVVLGRDGGVLKPIVLLSQFGLGGKHADGNQVFSWIHVEDYFRVLLFLLEKEPIDSVVNCSSPNPVSNKEFMHTLRKTLHVRIGLPAPKFAIQLGAKFIGTEPALILNSSYVIPKRLLDAGLEFKFPTVDAALADLLDSE